MRKRSSMHGSMCVPHRRRVRKPPTLEIRKWCVWISDDVSSCTMYPLEIEATTVKEAEKAAEKQIFGTGEIVLYGDTKLWEDFEREDM